MQQRDREIRKGRKKEGAGKGECKDNERIKNRNTDWEKTILVYMTGT